MARILAIVSNALICKGHDGMWNPRMRSWIQLWALGIGALTTRLQAFGS